MQKTQGQCLGWERLLEEINGNPRQCSSLDSPAGQCLEGCSPGVSESHAAAPRAQQLSSVVWPVLLWCKLLSLCNVGMFLGLKFLSVDLCVCGTFLSTHFFSTILC